MADLKACFIDLAKIMTFELSRLSVNSSELKFIALPPPTPSWCQHHYYKLMPHLS